MKLRELLQNAAKLWNNTTPIADRGDGARLIPDQVASKVAEVEIALRNAGPQGRQAIDGRYHKLF